VATYRSRRDLDLVRPSLLVHARSSSTKLTPRLPPPRPPARSKWNFHLAPALPSASKFFHMTQLFSRDQGGFVVALGLVNGRIKVSSQLPPLVDAQGAEVPLPEVEVERYWGRTTYHRMVVTWGPGGSVDCASSFAFLPSPSVLLLARRLADSPLPLSRADTVQDASTHELLLQYARSGVDVPAGGSVKCGLYRAHVCSAASAVVGDFQFSRR